MYNKAWPQELTANINLEYFFYVIHGEINGWHSVKSILTPDSLDSQQFGFRANKFSEDTISTSLQSVLTHL